jgi:hypothetical protein
MSRRATALAAAVPAPAAPGSALAQSRGDDQHRDPFAGEDEQQVATAGLALIAAGAALRRRPPA